MQWRNHQQPWATRKWTQFVCILGLCVLTSPSNAADASDASEKGRLIILADMGNEPDEMQQMAHMLVNCNEFELEGLIAVTGKYLNERSKDEYKRTVHPELFHELIEGYAQVEDNLRLHAEEWPTADALKNIVCSGQPRYGIANTGPGLSSDGSKRIVEALLRADPRPLNVVINAGSNTLAQALIDLRARVDADRLSTLVQKLRVFENGAQDNAGGWICHEFPGIHWIRSNHQTYGYMGEARRNEAPAGPYCWQPFPRTHQGQHRWAETHIMRGHGALGKLYPYRFRGDAFLEGGGTIPWLGLVNRGLYDVDHPEWGGWSGRFTAMPQRNVRSRHADIRRDEEQYGDYFCYTEVPDKWTDPVDGATYDNLFTPVWRWRRAMLNNCQARFDWCVKSFEEANHHPVAAIDNDATDKIIHRQAAPGDEVALDASASSDPDGDSLRYRWYVYPEAGTTTAAITLADGETSRCRVVVPQDAVPSQLHIVLEVIDKNEIVELTDYRRIIIDIQPAR